ncbi:MAG: response regulator [Alphaproteobacteria bacterium]|nr:response regulator [Alphaproteobacteria bacterium]
MPSSRVLLVEDDPAIAMLLEEMLRDLGVVDVQVEGRLEGALASARDGDFGCVILDLKLHGKETFEVARVLEERRIPFAFFTGYGVDSLKEYAQFPVLPKPFAESDLQQVVRSLMNGGSAGVQGGPAG